MKRLVLSIAVIFTLSLLLTGCGIVNYTYDNWEKYNTGGSVADNTITSLDVDWLSGKVEIAYHDGEKIEFFEQNATPLDDDMKMRYFIEGSKLSIRFAKSGTHTRRLPGKTLTLLIPEGTVLSEIDVESVSADLSVTVASRDLDLSTTSGNISGEGFTRGGTISCESTSGEITLSGINAPTELEAESVSGSIKVLGNAEDAEVELSTTSGNIITSLAGKAAAFSAETTSGEMDLDLDTAGRIEIDSTSADVDLTLLTAPEGLEIESTSGDVTLAISGDLNANLTCRTSSGRVKCSIPAKTEGKSYVFGSGKYSYSIETSSGDVVIKPAD